MRILLKSSLAVAGALALIGPAVAQGDNERNAGRKIAATLTGGAEVPGPGDDNGAGLFEARVNPGTERICYTLAASSIDPATAAHIHVGGPGVAGDPVLTLDTPDGDDDDSEDCQDIDRGLAQAIIQNPENYYVNIHTGPHPQGAIRGQLMKG
jgi:hypothetical protein